MSLEDAINRLASAAERNYSGSAVAEIIRQRDEAINQREFWKNKSAHYELERNNLSQKLRSERVRVSALRGVITRMKKARQS